MFNGMMDPELIRLAQEQMSRMSPDDFSRIQQQMMSNPELMKMATEGMKNMRPDDLRQAAEQLKHTRPQDMAEIGEKMAKASPEELASMRAHLDAQSTYQMNAAQMLKKQGNEFHNQGNFNAAAEKYLLAKNNLKNLPSSKGRSLLLACSLNLMSCYLKTKQYDECIKEGSEVLAYDAKNVKALYRRGQAYKELGQLQDAVSDLSKAHEVSPDDETIADVLRDTTERFGREGSRTVSRGLVIEEIYEEDAVVSNGTQTTSTDNSNEERGKSNESLNNTGSTSGQSAAASGEYLQTLKDDPEAIRSFQNFISSADPDTLAAMNGGSTREMSPDMFKTASKMISKMSPEDIQKMVQMASSFHGENPFSSVPSVEKDLKPTPDMLKLASDMMNNMSPEERDRMFEMAYSLKGKASDPQKLASSYTTRQKSYADVNPSELRENAADSTGGEASSSSSSFLNSGIFPPSNMPDSPADIQNQIKNQMKDPAMRQMFSSMIKNMNPEMMASMSEQFGMKLSPEDAAKAQQAMSSLTPEALDKMMRWADRVQTGVEKARMTKNWLLGKGGLVMAICMLILAVVLHRLGYIGS